MTRSFTPKAWHDDPTHDTPLSAAALADLETRLAAYTDTAVPVAASAGLVPISDANGNVSWVSATSAAATLGYEQTANKGAASGYMGLDASSRGAQDPKLHKATHEPGGADALTALTDASVAAANKDGTAGTASLRTLGTGGQQATAGNDSRLSDQRTPSAGSVTEAKYATLHHARVYNSAALSISDSTATALTFDSERYDNPNNDQHSTSSNTSRLTCVVAGLYVITGHVNFALNATGGRQIYVRVNGATQIAGDFRNPLSTAGTQVSIATTYRLAVNDYVELIAFQTSGGALNVTASAQLSPEFTFAWLSP